MQQDEEFIGTVDVWELSQLRWPIMRFFASKLLAELELGRYLQGLLATGRWTAVRVVPHRDPSGAPVTHVFDVYGVPVAPERG